MTPKQRATEAIDSLSAQERELAVRLSSGQSVKVIAYQTGKRQSFVEYMRHDMYIKLGINKVAQLAVICTLAGLVTDWRNAA